ncbi:MAG TPA: hypothetical protein DHV22_08085 [Xanthomarina gelatinilytica]|uniref:Uncharacterized protein n=1 Tax=Xanthomarina gelatinilytica TaxID=1137281 RepID=A0A3D6BSC5_9FLAO|nr:hypothetical protein [Xanthomarina gelatinilytica]
MAGIGILLDEDNDLNIINGHLAIGHTTMQEVGLIIQMQQGEQKKVPVLGPNIIQLKKTNVSKFDIVQRLRVHLAIDKKDYKEIKQQIKEIL